MGKVTIIALAVFMYLVADGLMLGVLNRPISVGGMNLSLLSKIRSSDNVGTPKDLTDSKGSLESNVNRTEGRKKNVLQSSIFNDATAVLGRFAPF